jgi:Domain of unknown function (DUF5916)/Carbohydrate family 9 binding domain-like
MVLSGRVRRRWACAAFGCVIGSMSIANAEGPSGDAGRKRMAAVRSAVAPHIDGRLDDACWTAAPLHADFTQLSPRTGAAPSERTTVQVCYDDRAVYVGLRAWDRDAQAIVSRLAARDASVESDRMELFLDSRHDHNTAAAFFLTAAGGQLDAFVANDGELSFDWDPLWEGAATHDGSGWTAELAIPLATLRYREAPEQLWGIQVARYIARTREKVVWTVTPRDRLALVSPLDHLAGIRGIAPRRTVEIRPFALLRLETEDQGDAFLAAGGGDGDTSVRLRGGLDLKLGLTRGLTLDLSAFPDFGQVEADERVLNLTRFETLFPEKRPFFLEGADLFATPLSLFYSRRIGRAIEAPLVVDGEPLREGTGAVSILGAAKVTGAVGRLGVAALLAVTGPERATYGEERVDLAPFQGFAVVRARQSFGGASYLGALATAAVSLGDAGHLAARDHDAYAQSLDGTWQADAGRLRVVGQVALSERVNRSVQSARDGGPCVADCVALTHRDGTVREPDEIGVAASLDTSYDAKHWRAWGTFRAASRRFDVDDVGFFQEVGELRADLGGGWRELDGTAFALTSSVEAGALLAATTDGTPIERQLLLDGAFDLVAGHFLRAQVATDLPGTFDPYETGDGARLERLPGLGTELELVSDTRGRLSGSLLAAGSFAFRRAALEASLSGEVRVVPVSSLELLLTPRIGWSNHQTRFYTPARGCVDEDGAPCSSATTQRRYRFADLESAFFSLTLRGRYMFTPRLSLAAYAQLFLARGAWDDYRTITTMTAAPRIRIGDLAPEPVFEGDLDGDSVPDDRFQSASLNVNVVLRWELRLGSTLQLIYSREQLGAATLEQGGPALELRGLGDGSAVDVVLMKLSLLFT